MLRESAPSTRRAWQPLPGVFVSNRGIIFPAPEANPVHYWMLLALLLGAAGAVALHRWARRRQILTGAQFPAMWAGVGPIIALPRGGFRAPGAPRPAAWRPAKACTYSC